MLLAHEWTLHYNLPFLKLYPDTHWNITSPSPDANTRRDRHCHACSAASRWLVWIDTCRLKN